MAFALVHKYVDGIPVYRLVQTFERAGVPVSRGGPGHRVIVSCEKHLSRIWTTPCSLDKAGLSFEHRRLVMSSQRFAPEFKEEAVRQVIERGYSVPDVASRLGVSAHSLYKWVKALSPDRSEQQSKELLEARSEILRLRAEMRRVEEERDLLKKAARYFARQAE
ncbi:transposase [Chelatococcus sp. HY11]|nr:transposase [Chelatococcus sp. HY11]